MPVTKKIKRVKVRSIVDIAADSGNAAAVLTTALSDSQKKKIGKAAAATYEKSYQKKLEKTVSKFVSDLEGAGVGRLKALNAGIKLRTSLQDAFIEGAASSHKTTMQRVTTAARAKKSNRADRYAEIRKEFKKHSKRTKTDALQRTAQATDASVATVRRALG